MNHPALAGFDDMQRRRSVPVMSAGDLAEISREEHRAKFKHTKLCSFYQKGQCTRTFDACAFLHTDDPEVIARLGGVPANAPNPHNRPAYADPHVNPRVNSLTGRPRPRFPPGSRIMGIGVPKHKDEEVETKRTVCRFFASGMCEYGKDCRFLHVVPEPQDRAQPSPKSATNTICRNYPACTYGDRCDFKHDLASPRDSPFSTASALPPSVSARPSPAVIARPLDALLEPSLGERLGLLGERPGSSVVGDRPRRHELARTASFGELPRRETGLLEERRSSLLVEERRSSLLEERRTSLLSQNAAPSPLARSSSLNLAAPGPLTSFGSMLGLGLERAHASQPHTRTHTPIPRAPSPSPTHIGIPPSRIVPHPATVLAPTSALGSSFPSNGLSLGNSNGAGLSLGPFPSSLGALPASTTAPGTPIRTLPPPGNEYSGTGWRVASPLPPHLASELVASLSAPGSPLALAPGSPLANAFNDGFFPSVPPGPERKGSALGLGLDLALESEEEGDPIPVVSYEEFGFEHEGEDKDDDDKERPRGYKTLPCKFFNPLLGRECPAGDECNFIHDKLFSNGATVGVAKEKEGSHPLFRTRECKYWAAGRCNQGDECPFKHTYGDDVEHGFEPANGQTESRENPFWRTRPCKWFQQGQCLRGDSCNYLHTLDTAAPVVCKFYPTPGCRNGAECPFVHADGGEYENDSANAKEYGRGNATDFGRNGTADYGQEGGNATDYGNAEYGGNGTDYARDEYPNATDYDYGKNMEDEDSEDDVIFEPMRGAPGAGAAIGPSQGGLSMLLSGLALNGHAQAQAQAQAKVN